MTVEMFGLAGMLLAVVLVVIVEVCDVIKSEKKQNQLAY